MGVDLRKEGGRGWLRGGGTGGVGVEEAGQDCGRPLLEFTPTYLWFSICESCAWEHP